MISLPPGVDNALRNMIFHGTTEHELQDAFESLLKKFDIGYKRECHIGEQDGKKLVIDFLLDSGEGVELKIKGAQNAVVRQLHFYARCDRVQSLYLVTTRGLHVPPRVMCGKDVGLYHVRTW